MNTLQKNLNFVKKELHLILQGVNEPEIPQIESLEKRQKHRELCLNMAYANGEETKYFHLSIEDRLFNLKGEVFNLKGQKLKQFGNANGYASINVNYFDKGRRCVPIQRLICEIFYGYDPSYLYEANHIDGNKQNNHISNLEWLTRNENLDHYRKSAKPLYVSNKLSRQDLIDMIELKKLGFKVKDIANSYNVSITYAGKLINGDIRRKKDESNI